MSSCGQAWLVTKQINIVPCQGEVLNLLDAGLACHEMV